jgi:hypothetical protein
MSNAKKIVEQLQARVDESMDTVEAIQGMGFRNLLAHVMACSQAMRMMNALTSKYEDDELVEAAAKGVAHVMAKGSSLLADAYNLDESKCEELMKWVDTLDKHVLSAIKEANK